MFSSCAVSSIHVSFFCVHYALQYRVTHIIPPPDKIEPKIIVFAETPYFDGKAETKFTREKTRDEKRNFPLTPETDKRECDDKHISAVRHNVTTTTPLRQHQQPRAAAVAVVER